LLWPPREPQPFAERIAARAARLEKRCSRPGKTGKHGAMSEDNRWKQRFENFERAFILLRSAIEGRAPDAFSELEMEGLVQRFEYTFELAWKTLKDYLEHSGVLLPQITPGAVIKAAYAAKLVADGQTWMDMLKHRNLMSHTYDSARFNEAVSAVRARYLAALGQVYELLKAESPAT
jgi:nucleotidyltransferase substrate binding protein (TIGR01987 family)